MLHGVGVRRRRLDGSAASSLPRVSWFESLLQQHGLQHTLSLRDTPKGPDNVSFTCSLLVLLQPGCQFHGPLTDWGREGRFLWDYHCQSRQMFTLQVSKYVRLEPGVAVPATVRHKRSVWVPPVKGAVAWDEQNAVQDVVPWWDVVQSWGQSDDALQSFLQQPLVVSVPAPLAALMAVGAWSTTMHAAKIFGRHAAPQVHGLRRCLQFPDYAWVKAWHCFAVRISFNNHPPAPSVFTKSLMSWQFPVRL